MYVLKQTKLGRGVEFNKISEQEHNVMTSRFIKRKQLADASIKTPLCHNCCTLNPWTEEVDDDGSVWTLHVIECM